MKRSSIRLSLFKIPLHQPFESSKVKMESLKGTELQDEAVDIDKNCFVRSVNGKAIQRLIVIFIWTPVSNDPTQSTLHAEGVFVHQIWLLLQGLVLITYLLHLLLTLPSGMLSNQLHFTATPFLYSTILPFSIYRIQIGIWTVALVENLSVHSPYGGSAQVTVVSGQQFSVQKHL